MISGVKLKTESVLRTFFCAWTLTVFILGSQSQAACVTTSDCSLSTCAAGTKYLFWDAATLGRYQSVNPGFPAGSPATCKTEFPAGQARDFYVGCGGMPAGSIISCVDI